MPYRSRSSTFSANSGRASSPRSALARARHASQSLGSGSVTRIANRSPPVSSRTQLASCCTFPGGTTRGEVTTSTSFARTALPAQEKQPPARCRSGYLRCYFPPGSCRRNFRGAGEFIGGPGSVCVRLHPAIPTGCKREHDHQGRHWKTPFFHNRTSISVTVGRREPFILVVSIIGVRAFNV